MIDRLKQLQRLLSGVKGRNIRDQALNIYIDSGITAFGIPVEFDIGFLDIELLMIGAETMHRKVLTRSQPPNI